MKATNSLPLLSILIIFSGLNSLKIKAQSTTCPSLDIYEILQDPVVQEALQVAWINSEEGTDNEHEEGGWIVHVFEDNAENKCKDYRTEIIPWSSGGVNGIDSGPKPSIENGRVVADFHTHPGSAKREDGSNNHVPSKTDLNASTFNGIPGIIKYGTGITPSTTFDLIYDGSEAVNYHSDIFDGLKTDLARFFDSRIDSVEEMMGTSYEATDPDWVCEDHSSLPFPTPENIEIFETISSIAPNPINHTNEVLFFDYLLKLEMNFMNRYRFVTNVYINSTDGSLSIIKEDIDDIKMLFRSMLRDYEKFEMHYIVMDANNDESSKLAYYGEDKANVFADASPFIGKSTRVENHFFDTCILNDLETTEENTTYKGDPYPWYRTEITTKGETSELKFAMEPSELISSARYFNSFVGILKDQQTKQNMLVVEFRSFAFHIKLLDIVFLDTPMAVDLKPYTILVEIDLEKGTRKYKEEKDLEEIQEIIEKAKELYKDCIGMLKPEDRTERNYRRCWDNTMGPIKDKYSHFVTEEFEY